MVGLTISNHNIDLSNGPVQITFTGTATDNVGISDVYGDGRSDLVWRDGSAGGILIRTAAGAENSIDGIGTEWALIGMGDFNGDGRDDILFRDHQGGIVAYLQLDGIHIRRRAQRLDNSGASL